MLLAAGPPRDTSCTLHSSAESAQLAGIRGTASVLSAVRLAWYCSASKQPPHIHLHVMEKIIFTKNLQCAASCGEIGRCANDDSPCVYVKQVSSAPATVAVRRQTCRHMGTACTPGVHRTATSVTSNLMTAPATTALRVISPLGVPCRAAPWALPRVQAEKVSQLLTAAYSCL